MVLLDTENFSDRSSYLCLNSNRNQLVVLHFTITAYLALFWTYYNTCTLQKMYTKWFLTLQRKWIHFHSWMNADYSMFTKEKKETTYVIGHYKPSVRIVDLVSCRKKETMLWKTFLDNEISEYKSFFTKLFLIFWSKWMFLF